MKTNELYNLSISEFKDILSLNLEDRSNVVNILFTILETELQLLNKHLDKLREDRDTNDKWMEKIMPKYVEVERKRDAKLHKLKRYVKELRGMN